MRDSGPLSVSLIVCESVLSEKTGIVSAIRITDVLTVGPQSALARFFVLTYLHSHPLDLQQHVAKVQLMGLREGAWGSVAEAPDQRFVYGYKLDPSGPGAFMLTTEFNLDLTMLGALGVLYVQVLVDGNLEDQTPLTLLRRG